MVLDSLHLGASLLHREFGSTIASPMQAITSAGGRHGLPISFSLGRKQQGLELCEMWLLALPVREPPFIFGRTRHSQLDGSTSYAKLVGGVSYVCGTLPAQEITFDLEQPATIPTAGKDMSFVMPTTRISIASPTNIFAVTQGTFTASPLKAYGILRARRVR